MGMMLAFGVLCCVLAGGLFAYQIYSHYRKQLSQIETVQEQKNSGNESAHRHLLNRLSEIRRPLQGILGVKDIYGGENQTAEMKDFLDVVDHCVRYTVGQLDRVQFYSEFEINHITAEWKPTNIHELVTKAVRRAESGVFGGNAKIDIEIKDDVSTYVMADARLVQTALYEVLANAVKHINCGPVTIEVNRSPENSNELQFVIADCGPGIGKDELAAALNSSSTQSKGLGIPIVRQVVKKMHGRYTIDSQPTRGTRFTMTLPLPPAEPKAQDLVPNHIHASSSRILVVDDEPMTRRLMQKLLEKLGHEVVVAENGRQALDLHTKHNFGVIFMDLEMPEMNGIETTKFIMSSSTNSKPHVIALTSHGLTEDRDLCKSAGMTDFLAKPASLKNIEDILQRLGTKPLQSIQKTIELSRMYALYGEDERLVKEIFRQAQISMPKMQDALNAAVMASSHSEIKNLIADLREGLATIHCDEGVNKCEVLSTLSEHPDTIEFLSQMEDLNKSLHRVMNEVNALLSEKDLTARLTG